MKTHTLLFIAALQAPALAANSGVQGFIEAFQNSSIELQKSRSNAPFPPMAYLGTTVYGESELRREGESETVGRFSQQRLSQFAALPFLLSDRDLLMVGEYLSRTRFEPEGVSSLEGFESPFNVVSVGVPVAWLRQVQPQCQLAAFVLPLWHEADQAGADWDHEIMTGLFLRYVETPDLWWAFGGFADFNDEESYALPYLAASWVINPEWTLAAIMPWPAVIYAPDPAWNFRVGIMPSSASWSLNPAERSVSMNLDVWDFGFSTGYRLHGNFWLNARVGIGQLGMFRLGDDAVEAPEFSVSNSPYAGFSLEWRPAEL